MRVVSMGNSSMPSETIQTIALPRSIVLNSDLAKRGWIVESGAVDLFLVAEGSEYSGIRRHVLRLDKNEAFTTVSGDAVVWMAVPTPDSVIIEIDQADLFHGRAKDACGDWIRRIASTACTHPKPSRVEKLEADQTVVLDGTNSFCGGDRMLWLTVLDGSVRIAGDHKTTLAVESAPFPLSHELWFSCTAVSTIRLCESNRERMEESLDFVVRMVSLAHLAHELLEIEAAGRRVDERRMANQEADSKASEAFSSVLRPKLKLPLARTGSDDAVVRAIAMVARDQHIQFHEPPNDTEEHPGEAARVVRILNESGLLWRRVLLDDMWWKRDAGSFLVFRRVDGAPLVMQSRGRAGYTMLDPLTLERTQVDVETMSQLEDRGIYLSRPFPEVPLTGRELLKFGLAGRRRDVWRVLLIGLALGVISLLTPLITSSIVGDIIPNAALSQLSQYTFLLVAMTASAGLFGLAQALMMVRIGGHLDGSLQGALWDRMMRLPARFFRAYEAGDLANRAMGINTINSTITSVSLMAILNGLFASLNFVLMLWYSWQLSLVGLAVVIISLCVAFGLTMWQLVWQRRVVDSQGKLTSLVLQLIGGVNKLRVANAESRAYSVWASAYADQNKLNLRAQGLDNALTVFNTVIPTISAIALFITIAAVLGTISIGDFLAFNAAFTQFFTGVVGLTSAVGNSIGVVPLYRRARPILDAEMEVSLVKQQPGTLHGRITFDHVSFEYESDGRRTLEDINLNIVPGEFVAIVGPSGAGKSTLFRLLMGFERPTEGIVAYDDKDLESLDVHAVRQQLGVVMQNSQIMPGSIFQNITGNTPELTSEDAWEVAKMAGLDEDIRAMPMGMETFITEGATTISTGQRQRLMIARALIKRPKILVLDEATSALDNRTQAIVTASLAGLNVTRIVIAQRLSTIVDADRIVVIDDGRVRQMGTYVELASTPGIFREMISRQLT